MTTHVQDQNVPHLTRRGVLRLTLGGVALVLGGGAVALEDAASTEAAQTQALSVGTLLNIKTLDPGRELENATNNVDHVTYDTLVTFSGEDLRTIRPSLATRWRVASDGLTYTFTLRPGVRFASGNPFTSADVKWSFERLVNIKGNGAFLLGGVDAVDAPDSMTVVLRLREPLPALLPILTDPALSPIDSTLVAAHGGDAGPDAKVRDTAEAYLNAHSAGTGAFVLASYIPQQELVLVANPLHWRGAPGLRRVVLRNVTEPSDQALMIEKGDLDLVVGIRAEQVRHLRGVPGVVVKSSLALNVVNIMMNSNPQVGGPFANPKVQQAVRYALDYDGILALAGPGAVRAAGVIPTNLPGARPPREAVRTDRERARALLKEAGAGDLAGTFIYSSTIASYGIDTGLLAQKVQQDLAAVGIRLSLSDLPYAIQVQMSRDGKIPIGIGGWVADYSDVSDYLVFLPGRTVGRRVGWLPDSSAEAQEIVRLGRMAETEMNAAKRVSLYQDVDRRLAEAGPYCPLFQPAVSYAFRSILRGVTYTTGWYVDYATISKA
jgi:peptide/nickel transport system substrate-binding protein